ncbi:MULTISPECIES: ADP-ribosyltransferase [Bacillus]|uniref:ADP ribosyltransferase domain-containing protein n=1 Tax=Bacillus cereus TaxID=1396 RepID=A0A9X6GDD2_BACCE|nr:ADP-ribosyltransferase [Bacillus cereus]OOR71807.1 hypothetical protein BLX06_28455 [Bacillus cereus]
MNKRKLMIVSLLTSFVWSLPILHTPYHVSVNTAYAANTEDRDFNTDKEAAKKWGEEKYKDWEEKKLTKAEKDIVYNYTASGASVLNDYLIATKGNLVEKQEDLPPGTDYKLADAQKYNEKIKNLEGILKKVSTPETVSVYKRVSETQFGMEAGDLRPNGPRGGMDVAKAQQIQDDFLGKTFEPFKFMSTSLSKDPDKSFTGERYGVLLHIKVPKGTTAAYISDLSKYSDQVELLIQRGYTYKYDKFTIINEDGIQSLKVDVSIVPQ